MCCRRRAAAEPVIRLSDTFDFIQPERVAISVAVLGVEVKFKALVLAAAFAATMSTAANAAVVTWDYTGTIFQTIGPQYAAE